MRIATWGIVLVLASGVLYTVERAAAWIAWGSSGHELPPPSLMMPKFADNGYVLSFLMIGLVLIALDPVIWLVRRELQQDMSKS